MILAVFAYRLVRLFREKVFQSSVTSSQIFRQYVIYFQKYGLILKFWVLRCVNFIEEGVANCDGYVNEATQLESHIKNLNHVEQSS